MQKNEIKSVKIVTEEMIEIALVLYWIYLKIYLDNSSYKKYIVCKSQLVIILLLLFAVHTIYKCNENSIISTVITKNIAYFYANIINIINTNTTTIKFPRTFPKKALKTPIQNFYNLLCTLRREFCFILVNQYIDTCCCYDTTYISIVKLNQFKLAKNNIAKISEQYFILKDSFKSNLVDLKSC